MENEIHIGNMIRNNMKEEGRSVSWLAKNLNCNRTNIYKIYAKSNIDMILLQRISQILHHDFFSDIAVINEISDKK